MLRRSALFAVPALVLALAPPALAAEDGVFFDDESPAGKEYAIPSDQARSQSGGGAGPSGGGPGAGSANGGGAPLFGQGVTSRAEARGSGSGGSGSSGSRGGSAAGGPGSGSGESGGIRFSAPTPGQIEADDAGSSPALWMGGAAVAIFFAGGLVATAARGRRRFSTY